MNKFNSANICHPMSDILQPLPSSEMPGYTHRGYREVRTRDSDGQCEIRDMATGQWVPFVVIDEEATNA